jgi:hypothetical protein
LLNTNQSIFIGAVKSIKQSFIENKTNLTCGKNVLKLVLSETTELFESKCNWNVP